MDRIVKTKASDDYLPRKKSKKNPNPKGNGKFVEGYSKVSGKIPNTNTTEVIFGKTNAVCQR